MGNGSPGGARWLDIAPERLVGWLGSFAERHGQLAVELTAAKPAPGERGAAEPAAAVTFRAADGSVAECQVPFPPLSAGGGAADPTGPDALTGQDALIHSDALIEPATIAEQIVAHATADRVVGVLLVRLGGYAAGVFAGPDQRLVASKVGSRLVHGRSAAGGTSQRRFARRREKQASEALTAAANTAAAVFGPYSGRLDAVVLGGDKRAMAGLTGDARLRPYLDLAVDRFLTVPDPRLTVLKGTPRMFRAVRIRLTEAEGAAERPGRGAEQPGRGAERPGGGADRAAERPGE